MKTYILLEMIPYINTIINKNEIYSMNIYLKNI